MADWTHKLVETRMMKVAELMDMLNPDNPRIHPQEQTDAIEELIDKVGFIDEIKVSRRSGKIINGHDRTKLAMIRGQSELPVNFYDLTEEEEAMALRFYDATGAMAEFDLEKLQKLAEISKPIEQDLDALGALMEKVREEALVNGMSAPPSLDELEAEFGEPDERDFWPMIKVQVHPTTYAKWDRIEFIEYKPGNVDTTFETITTDQLVVVSGIKVWSFCEHHLLPFWCDISIAYIAEERVLGLSKFARIAQKYAHRLQLQERLVHEIADEIEFLTDSENVAVVGKGEHLCMVMRGIKTPATMITSIVRGSFRTEVHLKNEFLRMI